jgi:hypothetical protein
MPIHPSSASDVARLIDELVSPDPFRRDTAAARLAVIGSRAVSKLAALAGDAAVAISARAAALEALASIGDARAASVATPLVDAAEDEVAEAAIGVLAAAAHGTDARATAAFDRLAELALDRDAPVERRLAALSGLDGLPGRLLKRIYEALARDPASRLVARVTRKQSGVMAPLSDLVDGALPDDPALVMAIVREDAGDTPVTVLRRLIDAIRGRETRAREAERSQWLAVRGQVHQALGARASRIALYDLRETLEAARGPLPVGFLAAAEAIGDPACLPFLAAAWVASPADERWWRAHLAEAFRAIARREGVKRRHPVLKKVLARWPQAGVLVASAKR